MEDFRDDELKKWLAEEYEKEIDRDGGSSVSERSSS